MQFTGDGGPAQAAGLSRPSGTALDAGGNLYIVDVGNNRIRRVDAKTGIVHTAAATEARPSSLDSNSSSIAIDRSTLRRLYNLIASRLGLSSVSVKYG